VICERFCSIGVVCSATVAVGTDLAPMLLSSNCRIRSSLVRLAGVDTSEEEQKRLNELQKQQVTDFCCNGNLDISEIISSQTYVFRKKLSPFLSRLSFRCVVAPGKVFTSADVPGFEFFYISLKVR